MFCKMKIRGDSYVQQSKSVLLSEETLNPYWFAYIYRAKTIYQKKVVMYALNDNMCKAQYHTFEI